MIPFLKKLKPSLFSAVLSGPASSGKFRLSILAVFLISISTLQLTSQEVRFSNDLLFLSFILLTAFWFGVRGGVVAALLAGFSLYSCILAAPDASPLYGGIKYTGYLLIGAAAGWLAEMFSGMKHDRKGELFRSCSARISNLTVEIVRSTAFRVSFVAAGFIFVICLRMILGSFALSLGYIYLLFISLAGYWFGLRGGLAAAFAATFIGGLELHFYQDPSDRTLAMNGMLLRSLIYFLEGTLLGYLHEIDLKLREEKRNKEYFETLAYHDELTGCVNFRWAMQLLTKEIALANRYHTEMTLVMLDLDHFKKINDELGHLVGNDALRFFSGILRHNIRTVDVAARYGGDEFMLLLHDASTDQALALLTRVRELLMEQRFRSSYLAGRGSLPLTFSAGIVSCPRNGTTVNELIDAGDHALYQAKEAGRDRIFVEKRRWARLIPKPGLQAELLDPSGEPAGKAAAVSNISQRGALLLFPEGNLPQEEFLCRFSLGSRSLSELKCRVVREGDKLEGLYTVGIYFVEQPFVRMPQAAENKRI